MSLKTELPPPYNRQHTRWYGLRNMPVALLDRMRIEAARRNVPLEQIVVETLIRGMQFKSDHR